MQVFIVGSVIETIRSLDPKRFNKQILETKQIISAIEGKTEAWKNHPCVLQYKYHIDWLRLYLRCFEEHKIGNTTLAICSSLLATEHTPSFHTPEYLDQMKRRLYTKNPEFYKQWSYLGTSDDNWYYVCGIWRIYKNGKRIQ